MADETGIYVEAVLGYRALRLVWYSRVEREDVVWAFRMVASSLDNADAPLDMLIDVRDDPDHIDFKSWSVPVDHPRLGRWFIVGTSNAATMIAAKLSALGVSPEKVLMFNSQTEAFKYLRRDYTESSL